jgi:hypothetical protein
LISFQMMRVISSPSISTIGFFTLIFVIYGATCWERARPSDRRSVERALKENRSPGSRGAVYSTNGPMKK